MFVVSHLSTRICSVGWNRSTCQRLHVMEGCSTLQSGCSDHTTLEQIATMQVEMISKMVSHAATKLLRKTALPARLPCPNQMTESQDAPLMPSSSLRTLHILRFVLQIRRDLLMPRHEKRSPRIILPHQHPNLLCIPTRRLILGRTHKVLEQESHRGFHALTLDLPKSDLVDDCRWQDRVVLLHLRVRVRGQKTDDLIARDTHAHRAADGLPRDFAGHHIGVTSRKTAEELQDGDLQLRGGVSVDAVVCLNDNEALAVGGAESVFESGGYAAKGAGVGCEGRGETGRVEAA